MTHSSSMVPSTQNQIIKIFLVHELVSRHKMNNSEEIIFLHQSVCSVIMLPKYCLNWNCVTLTFFTVCISSLFLNLCKHCFASSQLCFAVQIQQIWILSPELIASFCEKAWYFYASIHTSSCSWITASPFSLPSSLLHVSTLRVSPTLCSETVNN